MIRRLLVVRFEKLLAHPLAWIVTFPGCIDGACGFVPQEPCLSLAKYLTPIVWIYGKTRNRHLPGWLSCRASLSFRFQRLWSLRCVLMPEVTMSGKDHGHIGLVRGGNNFLIADGAAGLDAGGGTRIDGGL